MINAENPPIETSREANKYNIIPRIILKQTWQGNASRLSTNKPTARKTTAKANKPILKTATKESTTKKPAAPASLEDQLAERQN